MNSDERVIIDGDLVAPAAAAVSVFDLAVQRGFGCFEAIRCYGGIPFRLGPHLDRLAASAAALGLPPPPREEIAGWVADRAAARGDGVVRVFVTPGSLFTPGNAPSRVVVFSEALPDVPDRLRVLPLAAPWHADGFPWALSGAKTTSYAPNVASYLQARRAGFDDALLLGRSGHVLEGPTFSVAWVVDGALETPGLELGILASITRDAALGLAAGAGIEVRPGLYGLARLELASEVVAMSTVKEILPVVAVGDVAFLPGPVTEALRRRYRDLIGRETGAS